MIIVARVRVHATVSETLFQEFHGLFKAIQNFVGKSKLSFGVVIIRIEPESFQKNGFTFGIFCLDNESQAVVDECIDVVWHHTH